MNFNKFNPFKWQLEMLTERHGQNPQDEKVLSQMQYLIEASHAWDERREQMYSFGNIGEKHPFFLSGAFSITNPQ